MAWPSPRCTRRTTTKLKKDCRRFGGGVIALRGLRAIVIVASMARELDAVEQTP